jgi:hypothetical protein
MSGCVHPQDERTRDVFGSYCLVCERQVSWSGVSTLSSRVQIKEMCRESRTRLDDLADKDGCEVALERAWHEGRLATLDALGLGTMFEHATDDKGQTDMTEPEQTEVEAEETAADEAPVDEDAAGADDAA